MIQRVLVDDDTDGTKAAVGVRNSTTLSFFVRLTGGTSADIAFEATADPTGQAGYEDLPFRTADDPTYSASPLSLDAGDAVSLYADVTVRPTFVRAVVSNQTGPSAVYCVVTVEQ